MQTRPTKNIPPPLRPLISARLRSLERGESWLFEGGNPSSIQAIMTRVKNQFGGSRMFTSEWQGTGLRVWRTK